MATDATGLMTKRVIAVGLVGLCVACCTLLWGGVSIAQETSPRPIDRVDWIMFEDPSVLIPQWSVEKQDAPIDLWMTALERPDPELRRLVIDSFIIANSRGMQGLRKVVPQLVRLLGEPELDRQVEMAAVRALVAFEERDQDKLLGKLALRRGVALAGIVEPALAAWKSEVMLPDWRERLNTANGNEGMIALAANGVASLGDRDSIELLFERLDDQGISGTTRLSIARAIGQIETTGLEDQAETRIGEDSPNVISDLIAVRLLENHTSDRAVQALLSLANRDVTAVQAEAMERLFEIDFRLLLPLVSSQVTNADVNVRRHLARAMYLAQDAEWIPVLAMLLNDVNPGLRAEIADRLVDLAGDEGLLDDVIASTEEVLAKDAWRACEQAIYVLIALEQEQISDRLVNLMNHDRGEVMIAAGWGLRRLELPRHLPEMFDRASQLDQGIRSGQLSDTAKGPQELLAQLFLAFGQQRYQRADPLMRKFIPKRFDLGIETRPAAVWALGYLHEGEAPADLTKAFIERVLDDSAIEPELDTVRRMAAVGVGRMKSKSALPMLKQMNNGSYTAISQVSSWSIEQITGAKGLEPSTDATMRYNDWFLSPLGQPTTD